MEDNEAVTAAGGADTSNEVMLDEELVPDDSTNDEGAVEEEAEEFRGPNAADRYAFLECNVRIGRAQAAGDVKAEAKARADRAEIANRFVARNTRFAYRQASRFMAGRSEGAEHMAAAMLGLWEAFAGTGPAAVDGVIVNEDGSLSPTGGWDPAKGTFSTFSGRAIFGRSGRSVRASESSAGGITYSTWTKKPRVDRARAELTEELGGITPSNAQIAERAGVTEETVRVLTYERPKSLDSLMFSDNGTSLSDVLEHHDVHDDIGQLAEDEIARLCEGLPGLELLVLLLRTGMHGRPRSSLIRAADKLAIGRGSVALADQRARDALKAAGVNTDVMAALMV